MWCDGCDGIILRINPDLFRWLNGVRRQREEIAARLARQPSSTAVTNIVKNYPRNGILWSKKFLSDKIKFLQYYPFFLFLILDVSVLQLYYFFTMFSPWNVRYGNRKTLNFYFQLLCLSPILLWATITPNVSNFFKITVITAIEGLIKLH